MRNILNVECCVSDIRAAPSNVSNKRPREPNILLETQFRKLDRTVNQWIRTPPAHVLFLEVVDLVERGESASSQPGVLLANVELHIHLFQLHNELSLLENWAFAPMETESSEGNQEKESFGAHVMPLPHIAFENIWKSMILLHGPPGTGKSTLSRALSQRLAIRLRDKYQGTRLIEISAAALFSKYFGESSKVIGRLFDRIAYMLDQEPQVFLCIIVDEIESLTASRVQLLGSDEPKDAMRDPAFLDRIDIRQYIPSPGTKTRYEIFRQCYLDLLECKVISLTKSGTSAENDMLGRTAKDAVVIHEEGPEHFCEQASEMIPTYDAMRLRAHGDSSANEFSVSNKLWTVAEKSAGMSGRVLQRLPVQALAKHVAVDPCSIEEALDALARLVDEQRLEIQAVFDLTKLIQPQGSFNPTQIFADDVTEEKGENARLSAFVGAIAVGDLVKSTLGPKGMDKILQSASTGEIMVTNDGATILKSIALDNAAAKVLVNISKVQDDEVGDGTTSVAVLAAELLREAEKLVERKLHPQTIIEGYRIASNVALEALAKTAQDHSKDKNAFRKDLLAIARTTLSSKVLSQDRDHFASLACDAVLRLRGSTDLSHIQIIKKAGGKLNDSYLDEGFILDKRVGVNQPKRLENAKILVANTAMDTDKVKIFGARVKVDSTGGLAKLEEAEREKMKQKVEKIKAHGINCFVNRQLIYNRPEQLFSDAGIVSIEHADFDGIERLALVTGGEIASTFDHPEMVKLGHCDLIEEVLIGEDTLIKFSGVAAGEACTIVLRGATEQLLDEADRSLHDALAVLSQTAREPKTTLGGGCAEMVMAKAVELEAPNVAGKKAIAVEAFAAALRQLPTILADNAGFDSSDLIAKLKKEIYNGKTSSGLDLLIAGGGIADMREKGVIESYKLKRAVVSSAAEAAELLLRVDSIVRCAPRKRERM
ncbi:MAG: hypothetical protein Q9194_002814 [Teloschistes cf. exilis]